MLTVIITVIGLYLAFNYAAHPEKHQDDRWHDFKRKHNIH